MFDLDAQPQSPDEWLEIARRNELSARRLAGGRDTGSVAWNLAGHAVECVLKAVIMSSLGLNRWPSRGERPDIHSHDLQHLARIAGVVIAPSDEVAASWATVVSWKRGQSYNPMLMPRPVIRGMMEAAFGTRGVVPWIRSSYLPHV